jgi:hypothetical protein
MSKVDLIFPVYINQRAVFDFVATMQDGIATVTRVTVTESEERNSKSELSGSFGLGAAMNNFFKIDAKAGKNLRIDIRHQRRCSRDSSLLSVKQNSFVLSLRWKKHL